MTTAPIFLSDQEFNDNLTKQIAWVHDLLTHEKETGFMPCLCVAGDGAELDQAIVAMPDFVMDKRHEILMSVGAKFGLEGKIVRAAYFLSEAWKSIERTDDLNKRKYARPADDPERQEIVMVAGMSFDGRANQAQIAITRDKSNFMVPGKITYLYYGSKVETHNELLGSFWKGYVAAGMARIRMDKAEKAKYAHN